MSENIRVRIVVGRFLEHSRVYVFETGGESSCFLGSADLMPRNLDHRVEIVAPVDRHALQQELTAIFDSAARDTAQAWELGADGGWTRRTPKERARARPQAKLMRRAGSRRRAGERRRRRVTAGESDRRARQNRVRCGSGSSTWARTRSACWSRRAARRGQPVREEREHLGLGEDIERNGRIRRRSSTGRRRRAVRADRAVARRERDGEVVTAPGRQGDERRPASRRARPRHRRAVATSRAEEEGGSPSPARSRGADPASRSPSATWAAARPRSSSARAAGPAWARSFDIGSLRLTRRIARERPAGQA